MQMEPTLFSSGTVTRSLRIYPQACYRACRLRAGVLLLAAPPSPPQPPAMPPMPAPPLLEIQSGTAELPLSRRGEIHRLVKVRRSAISAPAGHWPVPAARSYDGAPWELMYSPAAAGGVNSVAVMGCSPHACNLTLRALNDLAYRIDVHSSSDADHAGGSGLTQSQRAAAKFLMHATFGPTRAELTNVTARLSRRPEAEVFADWVAEQINLPPTLHREFYRARANPRVRAGAVGRRACEALSRWHRYSVTVRDINARVRVSTTDGVSSLHIDGLLRTQFRNLSSFDARGVLRISEGRSWEGFICRVMERFGDTHPTEQWMHRSGIEVNPSAQCEAAGSVHLPNPTIEIVTAVNVTSTLVLAEDDAVMTPIPWIGRGSAGGSLGYTPAAPSYVDVAIMSELRAPCTLSTRAQITPGAAFMIYNGTAFMHDPRLPWFDNRLQSMRQVTLRASNAAAHLEGCHNAPKTFLNADSCRPSVACSPVTYKSAGVVLNNTAIRTLQRLSNTDVYAIDDLPHLDVSATSPCMGTARWRRLWSTPCGTDETPLDADTKATLIEAVRSSADAANPLVRDAVASAVIGGTCTASRDGISATAAKLTVDGSCWQHSHPMSYNVYDLSQWALIHPGNAYFSPNANPIKAVRKAGTTVLHFPASHSASQLQTGLSSFALLGKLGDVVDFLDLPSSVQTNEAASAFDALWTSGVSESCGSPGEIQNDPLMNNHFFNDDPSAEGGKESTYYPYNKERGYSGVIHLHTALHSQDQLRQRAAHALVQVFVIGVVDLAFHYNTELFVAYYDIMIRHAFGNARDILKEVILTWAFT